MRRAAKVDANHNEIVQAARAVGCSVWSTAAVGKGFPDLVVACPRTFQNWLIEVKDGSRPPSERKLTPDEQKFHREWVGRKAVVENVEQLYILLGVKN